MTKLLNWLGLAQRAGAIVTGEESVMQKIRNRQAVLVLMAGDIGANSYKKFQDKCKSFDVPLLITHTKTELGDALGKSARAVIAVTNRGLAEQILQASRETIGGDVSE